MTQIAKAADAAQFLSLVPRMLGFTPTRSLVVIPMSQAKSIGVLRVDLPPDDEIEHVETVASTVIGMVCRLDAADSLCAVVYTDCPIDDALPHRGLHEAIAVRADASGLGLLDALAVTPSGWGSFFAADHPAGGHPLDELASHDPALPGVAPGDQAAGATIPRKDKAQRRGVAAALRSLRTAVDAVCGIESDGAHSSRVDPAALEAVCALDELPRLYENALRRGVDQPMDAAVIAWCLNRPSLRDVALVQWCGDTVAGQDAMEAQRRWEEGEQYPVELASVMWGEGRRPDPERLETALALCRDVAALAPKRERPGALAVCAWLSWALGRSTHADRYARMVQALEPDHGLADIVRSFVAAGHLPDWAFRRA